MTNFCPIFPLELVVYPEEKINLHIFEPRYKQLIQDCLKDNKLFGIPAVINHRLEELGCLMQIEKIVKVYENGEMDITVRGVSVIKVLEIIHQIPNKLYSGAIINHLPNQVFPIPLTMKKLLVKIRQFHLQIQVTKNFAKPDELLLSYDVAHHIGLTLQEEYELLNLLQEDQRLEFLKRHLSKHSKASEQIDQLRAKIQLNGHFKELRGFNLE